MKDEDINVAKAKYKETQFINHYGPTEATIGCIANKIEFNAEFKAIDVELIGNSIANSEAIILNNSLTTNPNYFFGQLCITGEGLALGYLNQPEITDSRFITNKQLKERSYLTGDLAVKVTDNQIMYLHRKDNQIKFNGYRVELEEIEKTLKSNPNIEDAVIILDNTNLSQRLKGFFTLKLRQETHEKHIQSAEDSSAFNNYAAKIDSIKKFPEFISIQTEKNKFSNNFVNCISDILSSHLVKISKSQSLTEREKDRYKRQMLLTGWDEHAQLILKNSKVFVAGAGGGASPTLVQLAMAGIGTIVICDFDTVELSNLNRQFVHREDRIGMDKTESAGRTLAQINSDINIITIKEKLEEENIDRLIGDAEIIFDMFDNPAEKFLISEYAHKKGIPHVIAGMIDINGYACIFHSDHTACYNCVFDKAKHTRLLKGLNSVISNYSKKSLAVSSSSLFMGSGFVVNEAIKYLLGFKDIAWNKFIYFNSRGEESLSESFGFKSMTYLFNDNFKESSLRQGFDWNIGTRGKMLEEITFDKDPQCPVCATRLEETDRHINSESISLNTQNKKVVTSDNYIAILIEPNDVNFFVSALSVIKASKNLLLLNPESTEVSINRIIDNENISVIITDSKWYSKLNSFDINQKREIIIVDINKYQQSNIRYKASSLDYSNDIRILDYSNSIENIVVSKVLSVNEEMERWQTDSPGIPDKILKNSVATTNLIGFLSKNGVYELSNINKESLTEELKEFMAGYLPNYMIPQQLIQLDSMPLTLNGKIDKNALSKYSFSETETGQISELTGTERKLAEIWSEILDIDVSLFHTESDFFKMGGHSINAITFENKAERIFNVNISISDIFEHTTISSMGLLIDKKDNKTFKPVKRVEKKEYYLVSAAQKRMFMMDKLKDGKNEGDTTPAVFIIRGKLDIKKLESVFNQLVQLHESLRTSFDVINQDIVQIVHENIKLSIRVKDVTEDQVNSDIERFITSFDLTSAPLVKVELLKLNDELHYLLINMHHIITDGNSYRIFVKDFISIYEEKPVKELKLQYKDFSHWQNENFRKNHYKHQRQYWLDLYKNEIPEWKMPTDKKRDEQSIYKGAEYFFNIEKSLQTQIDNFVAENDLTRFTFLFAAYNILLSKYSGSQDIVVGVPVLGRHHEGLEQIIGFFVNTLPMRSNVQNSQRAIEYIMEVKRTSLLSYQNQDYPINELIVDLKIESRLNMSPLFSTIFQYLPKYRIDTKENLVPLNKLNSLQIDNYSFKNEHTQVELLLHAYELDNGIGFKLIYNDLYNRDTIEFLANSFVQIVKNILVDKSTIIEDLSLYSADVLNESQESLINETDSLNVNFDF